MFAIFFVGATEFPAKKLFEWVTIRKQLLLFRIRCLLTHNLMIVIQPQSGPQEDALKSQSKIVLLGGAKGGGKSYALRLAPCYHLDKLGYHAVIFRRSLPQCKKPGGLWDKSFEIYPHLGGQERISELKWVFPSGATIMFGHLQQPTSWLDWQGTETAFYGFDQLEEFTQNHFLKILGSMRTTSNASTQIMATMNPDASSWVRSLVSPWIASDGYIHPQKNGKTFYFTVEHDGFVWVDASWRDMNAQPPISISYFSADIWDNPALLQSDPGYLSNLMSQSFLDRERFLGIKGRGGNWNIKAVAGTIFKSQWFHYVSSFVPIAGDRMIRFWDFAATVTSSSDYTVGCLIAKRQDRFFVIDVTRYRLPPAEVNKLVVDVARADGQSVGVRWQLDPGSAGVRDSALMQNLLSGLDARPATEMRDKVSRALPLSAAFESGAIAIVQSAWNQNFITELENFPDGSHDDQVDASTGAYNCLSTFSTSSGNYRF
jgi:predicted phage terminase large subunit-like protein